jgi:hypothetical protein
METLTSRISDFSEWRHAISQRLVGLSKWAEERALADPGVIEQLKALDRDVKEERVNVAFVAEFSRGKSELINAVFFASYGRRMLPATAGRTTMCPSELMWDESLPTGLRLLPVETRREPTSLADWKANPGAWTFQAFDLKDPDGISMTLLRVAETIRVSPQQAQLLGLYNPDSPSDGVPLGDDGMVEIPKWRHAIVNIPHPLLKQGLVILDTPGLNAIGAEPELTLSLLPSAHAVVFILAADAGVTKSDLEIWERFLSQEDNSRRYVVLNKIDGLWDELSSAEQIERQIQRQVEQSAQTLGIDPGQVLPVSAQKGLIGKVKKDQMLIDQSRIEGLERALSEGIVSKRRDILANAISQRVADLGKELERQLASAKREYTDQLAELRTVRGKNKSVMQHLQKRIELERDEFERSQARVQAMRSVHVKLVKEAHSQLAVDRLKDDCDKLRAALEASALKLNAKDLFNQFFVRIRQRAQGAEKNCAEIQQMLAVQLEKLNTELGFSVPIPKVMTLRRLHKEIDMIEQGYGQHVSLTNFLRLQQGSYLERLLRSIYSRLRTAFESALRDMDAWNKASVSTLETQLRERRKSFSRRIGAVDRIEEAIAGLQERIDEAKKHEVQLQRTLDELRSQVMALAAPGQTLQAKTGVDIEVV